MIITIDEFAVEVREMKRRDPDGQPEVVRTLMVGDVQSGIQVNIPMPVDVAEQVAEALSGDTAPKIEVAGAHQMPPSPPINGDSGK